jgi:gamma-glutamyl-gamma-aminobutyrate hydrolase PuuD
VVEAVEWTGSGNWIVGVQWHPEKMAGDPLAEALFNELVAVARKALVAP